MKKWKINSWRNFPAKHIPEYPDKKELDQVLNKIKTFPPLVFAGETRHLKQQLAELLMERLFYYKEETALKVLQNSTQIILETHLKLYFRCL